MDNVLTFSNYIVHLLFYRVQSMQEPPQESQSFQALNLSSILLGWEKRSSELEGENGFQILPNMI